MDPAGFDHIPNTQNARKSLETSQDVCLDVIESKKL